MSDVVSYVHMALTAITALTVALIQFMAQRKKDTNKEDIAQLKTEVAVLQSQLANETHLLERLDNKLDRFLENC